MVSKIVIIVTLGLALLCTIIKAASVMSDESAEAAGLRMFQEFMSTHRKSYPTKEEHDMRFEIFKENLRVIKQRNQFEVLNGGSGNVHGVTKFSDLSQSEFKARYTSGYRPKGFNTSYHGKNAGYKRWKAATATTVKDWTGIYTTPMRDQGACGSCWAFAAVKQVESDAIRLLGWPATTTGWLSAQQVTSCSTRGGLQVETDYSYTSGAAGVTGTCKANSANYKVGISSYNLVSQSNIAATVETAMANYVLNIGPLSICLDASQFNSYSTGIMSCPSRPSVDHCVQAVGVNTGATKPYWILRNQWGTSWGMNGFVWLPYGSNACDLTCESTYVVPYLKAPAGPTQAPVSKSPSLAPVSLSPTPIPSRTPTSVPLGSSAKPSTRRPSVKPSTRKPRAVAPSVKPSLAPSFKPSVVPTPLPVPGAPSLAPVSAFPTSSLSACVVDYPSWLGDGWCDNMGTYNTANCNWDNGDCCPQSCRNQYYVCGTGTYVCMNPAYSAMPIMSPTLAPTTLTPTKTPIATRIPTSTPSRTPLRTAFPTSKPMTTSASMKPTLVPTNCNVLNRNWVGDGWCDSEATYNSAGCNWDGGDCCAQTCAAGRPNACGVNGYTCMNPQYNSANPTSVPTYPKPTSVPVPEPTPVPVPLPTVVPTPIPLSCPISTPNTLGDGICDWTKTDYNTAACGYDGGDCCASTCSAGRANPCGQYPYVCVNPDAVAAVDTCPVASTDPRLGNGFCSPVYNTPACNYDGGDCCYATCNAGRTYPCGSNTQLINGYQCVGSLRLTQAPQAVPTPKPVQITTKPSMSASVCATHLKAVYGPYSYSYYQAFVGDGVCQSYSGLNTPQCGYDGGDCCLSTCQNTAYCAKTLYNLLGYANYDCKDPAVKLPTLSPTVKLVFGSSGCNINPTDKKYLGDGYCDGGKYNTAACNWDGGDCCASTCIPFLYTCGYNGYSCKPASGGY